MSVRTSAHRAHYVKKALYSIGLVLGSGMALLVTGCGGSGSSSGAVSDPPPPATFHVSGTISGLTASGLSLANATDTVSPAANATTFSFPTSLAGGASYAATVSAQPAGQTCTVSNGSGTIAAANVTNIAVSCAANTYSVGGSISGLNTAGLTLASGSDTVSPAAGATAFTLPTKLLTGATYSVTISAQPAGKTCTVSSGSGTIAAASVTSVQVNCIAVTPAAWHTTNVGPGGAGRAVLASDPSDAAFFVAWAQTGLAAPSAPDLVVARRFTDAAGWSSPAVVASSSTPFAVFGLGFDSQGRGYALFSIDTQTAGFGRYTPAGGWTSNVIDVADGSPPGPPTTYPPNTTVVTGTDPVGDLAVFDDGSARGLVLTDISASNPNSPPTMDRSYTQISAPSTGNLLTYGPTQPPELPGSSSTGLPYTYTFPSGTTQTRYYFPVSVYLPDDAVVSAPTAHNYAAHYMETDTALNGLKDADGNPLANTDLVQGAVLWVSDSPHPIFISDETYAPLNNPGSDVSFSQGGMALSDNGTALFAWSIYNPHTTTLSFYGARFDGASWGGAQVLFTVSGPNAPTTAIITAAAVNANGDGIIFFPTWSSTTSATTNTTTTTTNMMAVRVDGKTGAFAAAVPVNTVTGSYPANGAAYYALLDIRGNAYVMQDGGVFRIAAGNNSYDLAGLGCTCDTNTGGNMKLDRDGWPMVVWVDGNAVYAGRYH